MLLGVTNNKSIHTIETDGPRTEYTVAIRTLSSIVLARKTNASSLQARLATKPLGS